MITLKIYLEGVFKKKIKLLRDTETLGRSRSATLRLTDSTISGSHAQIKKTSQGIVIKDLGSSNGTYVNDKRIDTHVLKMSDRIRIGNIGLKVYSIDSTISATKTKKKAKKKTKKQPNTKMATVKMIKGASVPDSDDGPTEEVPVIKNK